jgi:hypothetical protein
VTGRERVKRERERERGGIRSETGKERGRQNKDKVR